MGERDVFLILQQIVRSYWYKGYKQYMVGLIVMCQVYVHLYIALDTVLDHVHFVPLIGVKQFFQTTERESEREYLSGHDK